MNAVAVLLGCAIVAGAATGCAGAQEDGRAIAGPVAARVVKVRDGDTIEVEARIWPMQTVRVAVRLRGVDAPELKAGCGAEKDAALAARDRLSAILAGGDVALLDISGDKYFGRVLARVAVPGEPDVGGRLLAEGYVGAYDGGRRRDWCDGAGQVTSLSR